MSSSARSGRAGDVGLGVGVARVSAAAADLYGLDPQEFTDRRKALAAAARAVGDAAAAKQISALRKPTRAAWIVNRLARADPGAPGRLASLAADLRAAEQARDGPRLRELSAARGQLIDALTGQALATAGVLDPPAGLREEVSATLTAALADPDVAAEFAAGTLTRAAQWVGFGLAPFGPAPDAARESPPSAPAARPAPLHPRQNGPRRAQVPSAEEAAQQAARRREAVENAERAVATATAATAETTAAEDRLEAEVRDLEDRLTQTRVDLAAARLRARRAEAAERKARQELDRLRRA